MQANKMKGQLHVIGLYIFGLLNYLQGMYIPNFIKQQNILKFHLILS